jgi:hypothetical protein
MGKIGRRGPHKERKKRIADERERERIAACARREFRRQAIVEHNKGRMSPEEYERHKRRSRQRAAQLLALPFALNFRTRAGITSRPNTY